MIGEISLLPVLIAVIADMAIGALWYSPVLFGKYWMSEMGMKEADLKNAGKYMAMGVLNSVIMMTVLAYFLKTLTITTPDAAIETAFLLWLGFVATGTMLSVIYEKRKLSVYGLGVSYQLVALMVGSIIITVWK
ncbi:MAG: DUF1761 domain-containing protein [Patescibacteria group bacterium]|nr:DUF1761 domain-containing protein [Patescibacteria group bacterium]